MAISGFEAVSIKPIYKVGDILWVRETWGFYNSVIINYKCTDTGTIYEQYPPSSVNKYSIVNKYAVIFSDKTRKRFYFNDEEREKKFVKNYFYKGKCPSIFMPLEAARIFLKVKSVKVERLQEISEKDAIAEGLPESLTGASGYTVGCFQHLWDSINAKRGYSFDSNPWAWVIEFERVENV
ncbi:MAG: hypothetical protein FWF38_00440 [Spirochaetaceae bacterium]|nr:hypothetical protein [Spirochaetaceae bacterium]